MIRHALVGALVLALAGCSVLKTQSPPPYPAKPACRQSRGPIVIDIIGGIIGAPVVGVLVYSYADRSGSVSDTEDIMIGASMSAWFVGAIGSAALGMVRTSRCRDAYEKYDAMTPRGAP